MLFVLNTILCVFGFFGMLLFYLLRSQLGDRILLAIGLALVIVSLLGLARWPWFEHDMPMWQFVSACVVQAIGYPIASALLYSIFSKVLNPRSQVNASFVCAYVHLCACARVYISVFKFSLQYQ